jgi:4-hydroxybenzoate polyprenyltransferase
MKRITWWPQAWLGLTFNWGALVGFAALTGHIALPALLLYAGCFFWTLGYDTIYAHQDKDDDALIGVKSTARLFGERSRSWISLFYIVAIALIGASVDAIGAPKWTLLLLAPAAGHLMWQAATLDVSAPEKCLRLFRANRDAGMLMALALIAGSYML